MPRGNKKPPSKDRATAIMKRPLANPTELRNIEDTSLHPTVLFIPKTVLVWAPACKYFKIEHGISYRRAKNTRFPLRIPKVLNTGCCIQIDFTFLKPSEGSPQFYFRATDIRFHDPTHTYEDINIPLHTGKTVDFSQVQSLWANGILTLELAYKESGLRPKQRRAPPRQKKKQKQPEMSQLASFHFVGEMGPLPNNFTYSPAEVDWSFSPQNVVTEAAFGNYTLPSEQPIPRRSSFARKARFGLSTPSPLLSGTSGPPPQIATAFSTSPSLSQENPEVSRTFFDPFSQPLPQLEPSTGRHYMSELLQMDQLFGQRQSRLFENPLSAPHSRKKPQAFSITSTQKERYDDP